MIRGPVAVVNIGGSILSIMWDNASRTHYNVPVALAVSRQTAP